jgi:hypothetical protein
MVWFMTREREEWMQVTTRFDNHASQFVISVRTSTGRRTTERFKDTQAFEQRLLALEQEILRDRWTSTGSPLIVPDGFPKRRT